MNCINRGLSINHESWICFCPEDGQTALEKIKVTSNHLCQDYLNYLHGRIDNLTELNAQRALRKMEDIANDNLHVKI